MSKKEIKGGMLKNIFLALRGDNPIKKLKELFFTPSWRDMKYLIYNELVTLERRERYTKKLRKTFWYKKIKNREWYESLLLNFIEEQIYDGMGYASGSSNRSIRMRCAEQAFDLLLFKEDQKELENELKKLRDEGCMDFYFSWAKEAMGYDPTNKEWVKKKS